MTSLVSGDPVPKNHPRIESYGTVDELGVWIGQARHQIDTLLTRVEGWGTAAGPIRAPFERLNDHLQYIQNLLFTLGGELATPPGIDWPGRPTIGAADVKYIEDLVDAYNAALPPLEDFILAGGGPVSLALHHARVICRRAERVIARLDQTEPVGGPVNSLVNRLSDLFFVLARWVVAEQNRHGFPNDETIWNRSLPPPPMPRR
jgi:cob(I)alamin adenosyltransferase